ncbi:adenylate/guanylate cyclase domain-containing protein [Streptomyces sp. NRRL WC-3742]|uniref:adenylate/guanylate cyclase domain-containing protein n=1 Tax=Streptomyces sp. NRRL WC-3742 TaxID=1463934 RepID=UPI00068CE48E|nr:adenylate/guanylate cyclase domain-containing protein [Streptomyces sp. NRRL WC-3742]
MSCPSCAVRPPAGARFCARCGAPTAVRGEQAAEERRIVTVLFCDLVGSTRLSGLLDVELLRAILLRYYALMEQRIEEHGGIVEKFIGDAVMAVFGLTATREDDAHRALAAARSMPAALDGLNAELERDHGVRLGVRIGVHTGEVVTTADPTSRQALVSGEVVNIAARLQAAADPGTVLLSAQTWRAAEPGLTVERVGPLRLKGVAQEVEAGLLVDVAEPSPGQARRPDVPFVGRERYLSELDLAWLRVVEERDVHVLTLLGEAGIGKSRLVEEWLRRCDRPVGAGRCRAPGTGGSLHALAECLDPLIAELSRAEQGALTSGAADAIGLLRTGLLLDGTPAPSVDATCAALAHVLTELTATHPVLLVLDDLHQAEQPLLGLLERLVEETRRLPVLLLCLARPELIDSCPGWGTGRANSTTVTLTGLSAADSTVLAAHLVDLALHDGGATEQIVAQADGNPLYLEQLAATVEETGGIRELPPTLQSLLAARIDRLAETERTVLRHASVVGLEFDAADLAELTELTAPTEDGKQDGEQDGEQGRAAVLRTLSRRGLVRPVRRPFGASAAYCFVNGVTRRVAYEGLTKLRRGELHERYAGFLVRTGRPDALIGTHFEQAYRYRSAVVRLDEHGLRLRERAVRHLVRAGSGALDRVDLPWALTLFERAAELTAPGDEGRPELLQRLGEVLLTLGRPVQARDLLTRAAAEADTAGAAATAAHARLHLAASASDEAALEHAAAVALPVFESAGDQLGLARSRLVLAGCCRRRGRHAEALRTLGLALTHSLAVGADRELANTLGATGLSLWRGPEPADSAVARCQALLAAHGADRPAVRGTLGFPLTVLHALRGRDDLAAESLAATRQAMAALAHAEGRVFGPLLDGMLAVLADRRPRAREALGEALEAARALRAPELVRTCSLELARLHLADGDWPAAAALVEDLAVPEGQPGVQADSCGVRARIRALRGEHGEALALARRAVLFAYRTDSPADRGTACLDLACARAAAGLPERARGALGVARRQFAGKGHLVALAHTERLLGDPAVGRDGEGAGTDR